MSAMQRNKGARGEREVIDILKAHGWTHARRTSDGRAQSTRGDVLHGPEGCHIEVKRQERLNVPGALTQAVEDAGPHDIPIVIHRPSRHEWMATLPLDELLPLLALREAS
jgi:hypothetical protein